MLTLVGLAVLDWRFLMAALLAVPIQVLTARWYLACSTPLYAEQRVVGGVQQQLLDTVGGVATARAFGLSGGHAERVRSRSQDVVDLALGVVRLQTRFFGRLNLAEFVGVAAVLTAGFFLVAAGPRRSARPARRRCTSSTCSLRSTSLLFLLDTAQSASASLVRIVGVAELPAEQQPEHPGAPGGRRGAHQGPRALLRRGPRGPSTVSTSISPPGPGWPWWVPAGRARPRWPNSEKLTVRSAVAPRPASHRVDRAHPARSPCRPPRDAPAAPGAGAVRSRVRSRRNRAVRTLWFDAPKSGR